MAGICHEIGAHALDLLFARQVAQHQERALALAQRGNMGKEAPQHRHAQLIFDVDRLLARGCRRHRLKHGGIADRGGKMEALRIGLQHVTRQGVGVQYAALPVHHQRRVRQRLDDVIHRGGQVQRLRARHVGGLCGRKVTAEGPHDPGQ